MNPILKYLLILVILVCFPMWIMGQNKASVLKIRVLPVFGNIPLQLNGPFYRVNKKDSVKIKTLKFYLSDLGLETEKGKIFLEENSYHLIDAEETESTEFTVAIDNADYISFSCSIGVDSAKNTAGILSGDLDPVKGMFWAWNTGYIAAKLEGVSSLCKTKGQEFDFHIGGYMHPFNSFRKMRFQLPGGKFMKGKTTVIELFADVSEWLKDVDLEKVNHIVVPGKEAMKMADNYKAMLKLKSISVE